MVKWEDWSQNELNIAMARHEGLIVVKRSITDIGNIHVVVSEEGDISRIPDYCGSWDVSMPVFLYNGIIVGEYLGTKKYLAISDSVIDEDHSICSSEITYLHDDPLIAGVIVYLFSSGVNASDRKNILN